MPARSAPLSSDNVAIPFRLRLDGDVLSFISTTMIFRHAVDITAVGTARSRRSFPPTILLPSGCGRWWAALDGGLQRPGHAAGPIVSPSVSLMLEKHRFSEEAPMSTLTKKKPLQIDIVSDVGLPVVATSASAASRTRWR